MQRDLSLLLSTTYKPKEEQQSILEKKKFKMDKDLSSDNTRVFYDEETEKPLIIHRGTQTFKDVVDDGLLAVGLGKYGFRYKNAQRITKKVEKKYQKPADTVAHSYGGWLAENSGAKGNITTYNKGV